MTGEYRNTVDEKGRLMIPPKIREQLGDTTQLMLTKSTDDSLWLFTKQDFEALNTEVNYGPLSMFNKNSRIIDMTVIAPAREIDLDKSGRLLIPQNLREYAKIEGKTECVILGSRNHVEIISSKVHEELLSQYRNEISQAGDELSRQRMDR